MAMQETVPIAAHEAILAGSDVSWAYGQEHLASLYAFLASVVVFWLAALYSVRFAIRFGSQVLLRRPLLTPGASPSEAKRAVEHQETDQGMRNKPRRAVFWCGASAAAPLLIWCCDMAVNELHRRSIINCFRAAERVSVEYRCSQRGDSGDGLDLTFFTGTHEITKKEHLEAIARDLSGIRPDERESRFLFIIPTGTVKYWGGPLKVSVYNSDDAAPRQFMINGEGAVRAGMQGACVFAQRHGRSGRSPLSDS